MLSLLVPSFLSFALFVSASAAFAIAIVALLMFLQSCEAYVYFLMLTSQHVPDFSICCLNMERARHFADLATCPKCLYLLSWHGARPPFCWPRNMSQMSLFVVLTWSAPAILLTSQHVPNVSTCCLDMERARHFADLATCPKCLYLLS